MPKSWQLLCLLLCLSSAAGDEHWKVYGQSVTGRRQQVTGNLFKDYNKSGHSQPEPVADGLDSVCVAGD
jgi:hypothetical protein